MNINIKIALPEDVDLLFALEKLAFQDYQQSSKQSLIKAVKSQFQEVLLAMDDKDSDAPIGAIILYKYPKTLRIFSIAVHPLYQNKGYGGYFLEKIFEYASENKFERIQLEVNATSQNLISWYEKYGFKTIEKLNDYYAQGKDAIKMEIVLTKLFPTEYTNNIIVINHPNKWSFTDLNAKVISVKEYISNEKYQNNSDLRIFNLCSSYKYQSYGYYVSLLASARGQRVVPSTVTIRDFRLLNVIKSVSYEIEDEINKALGNKKSTFFSISIYFGQSTSRGFKKLATKLYQLFEAPLFKVEFIKHDKWMIKEMQVLTLSKIAETELESIYSLAKNYFNKKRFHHKKLRNYKYDIAVLVNPNEKTPPSCSKALDKFRTAANKKGLYLEFITKSDIDKINEFDALFIRETTNVNDRTYEFSRMAWAEGLVVIDDPWSILRCSNKIYQHELFRKHKILTPKTIVFTKNLFNKKDLDSLNYPVVLKQPDSAFSMGVIKVDDSEEALSALQRLFKNSDMVVCQDFLYSEFDWRIGLIDNKPLFACKYYMSAGHWQIYNWKGDEEDNSGDSETLDISEVPDDVLKTAIKSSSLIGDGLYGVDLKMINNQVYVVEVNDNPNIDAGIEDFMLKDKLYDIIIDSIYQRIELAKNIHSIDFNKA